MDPCSSPYMSYNLNSLEGSIYISYREYGGYQGGYLGVVCTSAALQLYKSQNTTWHLGPLLRVKREEDGNYYFKGFCREFIGV